jgi:uncharacterized radical SAM superfamily protein
MHNLTAQNIWKIDSTELYRLLDSGILKSQSRTIRFYAPSFSYYKTKYFCSSASDFPTISVMGNTCDLNCKHCAGKILETMHPVMTPQELFELGVQLKRNGAKGVLVSGGCLPDGSIPLEDFTPVLGLFKRKLGLKVFVHTGMLGVETAILLKKAEVDAALIDVIGSEQTAKWIFDLKIGVQDYVKSLRILTNANLNIVPHVIVGLNQGKLDGEYNALQIIEENTKPRTIVIIAFMPIRGTKMEKTSPPQPIDIAKVVATARLMFPDTPIVLGCMRPKGRLRSETDVLALKAGVDGIAFPSEEAIVYAKKTHEITYSSYCCAEMIFDFYR